jgi:effector-binding domain-containing protein
MTNIGDGLPRFVERGPQPYVSRRARVTTATIGEIADRLPEVLAWLDGRGITPSGPPFLRYSVISMPDLLVVEAGFPVDALQALDEDDQVRSGTLPAGRYLTARHHGPPIGLEQATDDLLAWAAKRNLRFDVQDLDDGEHWACRLEEYLTVPADDPTMENWVTDLTFKLAN